MIKTAGSGYTLAVLAVDSHKKGVAVITTPPFSVLVGQIFKLYFNVFIGTAWGGTPFRPNPQISMSDRGNNVLRDSSNMKCNVYLTTSPSGVEVLGSELPPSTSTSKYTPTPTSTSTTQNSFQTDFVNGLATFSGLYIDSAGYPYQLTFNITATGTSSMVS